MSRDEGQPLSSLSRESLRDALSEQPLSNAARASIWWGIQADLSGGAPPDGGAPPNDPGPGPGGSPVETSNALAGLLRSAIPALIVGAGLGAGVYGWLSRPSAKPSPGELTDARDLPSQIAAPAAETSAKIPTLELEQLPSLPPQRSPQSLASGVTKSAPSSGLDLERSLLERARSAQARGDESAAARALALHEKQFQSGQLAEEREVLQIQSLIRAGSLVEARARTDEFRGRYPKSALLPSLERSLAPTP